LERGDVDVMMGSTIQLLTLINYEEKFGYKANYIFDQTYDVLPGFNRNEAVLASIMDKAFGLIDVNGIAEYWMRMNFDYESALLRAQRQWFANAASILALLLVIITTLYVRNIQKNKTIRGQSALLKEAHERTTLMLDSISVACYLTNREYQVIACNEETVRLFRLNSKQELIDSAYTVLPEYQPDGRLSVDVVRQVGFSGAFTFLYSPRMGTPAAKMDSIVQNDVAIRRFNELLAVLNPMLLARNQKRVGEVERVMVEDDPPHTNGYITGRAEDNTPVHFATNGSDLPGDIRDVRIEEAKTFYLTGKII